MASLEWVLIPPQTVCYESLFGPHALWFVEKPNPAEWETSVLTPLGTRVQSKEVFSVVHRTIRKHQNMYHCFYFMLTKNKKLRGVSISSCVMPAPTVGDVGRCCEVWC